MQLHGLKKSTTNVPTVMQQLHTKKPNVAMTKTYKSQALRRVSCHLQAPCDSSSVRME